MSKNNFKDELYILTIYEINNIINSVNIIQDRINKIDEIKNELVIFLQELSREDVESEIINIRNLIAMGCFNSKDLGFFDLLENNLKFDFKIKYNNIVTAFEKKIIVVDYYSKAFNNFATYTIFILFMEIGFNDIGNDYLVKLRKKIDTRKQ